MAFLKASAMACAPVSGLQSCSPCSTAFAPFRRFHAGAPPALCYNSNPGVISASCMRRTILSSRTTLLKREVLVGTHLPPKALSSPTFRAPRRPAIVPCAGRDDTVEAPERVLAAVAYLLPFLDGVKYGRYLYLQYPFARALLDPVVPLVQLYNGIPFAGFLAFFVLYLAIIQNPNMSRYVRFNAMQAVILDILMILPSLLERLLNFQDGVGLQLTIIFYNTVFLYLLACVTFGIASCLLGKAPRLPLVADAAEAQVPF